MRIDIVNLTASLCHESCRVLNRQIGFNVQPAWIDAPAWMRKSIIDGVLFHFDNPNASPAESHERWMEHKVRTGWTYGEHKDPHKKKHPCLKPFDELPDKHRCKDDIVRGICNAMRPYYLADMGERAQWDAFVKEYVPAESGEAK